MAMTRHEVMAAIQQQESDAYGYYSGELATQRADAIDRYNCLAYGDEVEGRSQVVTTDLRDTIEWMMPQLLKIFIGGDQVVQFSPKGPEDEQGAQQETDFCNHIILEKNCGFLIFSTWFRDALLQKNGYVKVWWERRTDILLEKYQGLSDEEMALLLEDSAVTVAEHSQYPDPAIPIGAQFSPEQPPKMLHDLKVRRVRPDEFCRVEPVPPEEVLVSRDSRSVAMQDLPFVQHRTRKTISELRQMGYTVPDYLPGDDSDAVVTTQEDARNLYEETSQHDEATDPSMRRVVFKETYIRIDKDGDGVAELRKVCHVAQHVFDDEEADCIPFACLTPIITPHRHIGVSYYDLVKEIARIRTILLRLTLDNGYLRINGRYGADVNKVNVDDLVTSRAGGVVRTDGAPGEALFNLVHPTGFQDGLEALQFVDAWRENATGISAYYQGLNADSLNKTATGISQIMTAAQARVEAVARTFAETGVRDLFLLVHGLTSKYGTQEEKIRLRNTWVPIDPREWVKRADLTVSVGLGSGSKQEKIGSLQMLIAMQQQGMQMGLSSPSHIYESAKELIKELGYKNPERFISDPSQQPPPQPQPPPEVMAAQVQAQGLVQKAEVDARSRIEEKQAELALEPQKLAAEAQIRSQENEQKIALEIYKINKQAEVELEKERIKAAYTVQAAQLSKPAVVNGNFDSDEVKQQRAQTDADAADRMERLVEQLGVLAVQIANSATRSKRVVRGPDGRVAGVETV